MVRAYALLVMMVLGQTLLPVVRAGSVTFSLGGGDTGYISPGAFSANIGPGHYLETFDEGFPSASLPPNTSGPLTSPPFTAYSFTGGSTFSYDANAAGGLFIVAPQGDGSLSTTNPDDNLAFTFPSATSSSDPVTAVGGYFFLTDASGNNIIPGTVTVTLDDGSSATVTDGDLTTFVGFTTTSPINSLTVSLASTPTDEEFITVDDLDVGAVPSGTTTATPEPSTLTLTGLGLLCLAGYRSKRRERNELIHHVC